MVKVIVQEKWHC